MNESIKQAMHLDACKSFGAAEANENERRWDDKMIDSKNNDSINNYDKTRMRLNFEIGPDGKIHSLGYQDKRLDVRLQERLNELGWRPFKADSKIQPNCCARLIFGGNRERTLEMAFGTQDLKLDKDSDNSHIHRCKEVEQWALDVYNWCCRRYGKENIIGFQVHLDETSPHIHALIVPVGVRPKSGRECVMWSAKFGKNKYEYGSILKEMHTSLYEEVGSKYGLERGDSVEGRNIQHLNKRDYIRKLAKEQKKMEKAIRGLQTMKDNIEAEMQMFSDELKILEKDLAAGRVVLAEYQNKKACIEDLIHDCQERLDDKETKLMIKQQELDSLLKDIQNIHSVNRPFKNYKIEFNAPQITEKSQFIEMYYNTHNKQTLESVCPIMNKGITPKYVESSSVLVINQACIHWDGQRLGNIKYHNEEIPVRKRILESGDVLLNATGNGTLGRCCVFICPSDNNTYINDGHVIALSTDRAVILPEVLNTYLSLNDTQAEIYRQYVTGSTNQVDIVFSDIKKMKVPVPSMDEQILFVEVLTQADKSEFVGCKSQFFEMFEGDEYPLIKLGDYTDLTWGDTNTTKNSYVTEGYLAYSASGPDGKLDHYDYDCEGIVLSAIGADCGKTWFASGKWSCIKNTIRFWSTFDDLDNRFLYFATREKDFWPRRGGAQPFIPQGDARNCSIPLPPICLQRKFVEIAEQADKSEYYN